MKPLVSVIVPCYNQSQFLDDCLESVLNQSYQNWECIIVNDGSPDNTEDVAMKWVEKDSRFKYLKKENGGISSARNCGISKANGEWILALDSDDKIGKEYLEKASSYFDEYDLIYCNAEFFGTTVGAWYLPEYNYRYLLLGNQIFCSAFFKKCSWEKAGGYDESLLSGLEDWELWVNILTPNTRVFRINYLGFYYRRKDNSRDVAINRDVRNKKKIEEYVFNKHIEKYRQTFPYNIGTIRDNQIFQDNSNFYVKKIGKNIFTKFLFSLINKF